jgi:hypothetical protein
MLDDSCAICLDHAYLYSLDFLMLLILNIVCNLLIVEQPHVFKLILLLPVSEHWTRSIAAVMPVSLMKDKAKSNFLIESRT